MKMYVVIELFKKKKKCVYLYFLFYCYCYVVVGILLWYILYFNVEKMLEKDNFILNILLYVSDLKIILIDGCLEKEGKGILEILSLFEEIYMFYCWRINVFLVNIFKIMGNIFLDVRLWLFRFFV